MRLTLALLLLHATSAAAQVQSYQCMRRVGTVLDVDYWWGKASQTDAGTPTDRVPTFQQGGGFVGRWAAFVNSRVNDQPGLSAEQDVLTAVIKFVVTNDRPWRDVFVGRFTVTGPQGYPVVSEDVTRPPHGVFGLPSWQRRYQGNEESGLMLQAAYRVLRATIGFRLTPSPLNATGDATAMGRQRAECRSCHFDGAYALDAVAGLLPWYRKGLGDRATLEPRTPTPATLFNGRTVNSFDELLTLTTGSDAFHFWSCRLVFEFTLGRPETGCEAPLFDACVDVLKQTQNIKSAIATVMQDPAYCAELWP